MCKLNKSSIERALKVAVPKVKMRKLTLMPVEEGPMSQPDSCL